jgi:hypothetical protein
MRKSRAEEEEVRAERDLWERKWREQEGRIGEIGLRLEGEIGRVERDRLEMQADFGRRLGKQAEEL